MNTKSKITFYIYLIISIISLIIGLIYLLYPTFMPYHEQALGIKWEDLAPLMQMLLNGFMKLAGVSMLTAFLSTLIITLIPFRQGKVWAKWTVPLLLILWNSIVLYITINIHVKTGAATPWILTLMSMVSTIFAFILSFVGKDSKL